MSNASPVHRVKRRRIRDIDEQLWSVTGALLLLGGCVAGLIVAHGDFGPVQLAFPGILHSAWIQLAGWGVAMIALVWGTVSFRQTRSARRMQLSVFMALLFHLWLAVGLHHTNLLFFTQQPDQAEQFVEQVELVSLPDYGRNPTQESVDKALTQAVETDTPDNESQTDKQETQTPEAREEQSPTEPADELSGELSRLEIPRAEAPPVAGEAPAEQVARQDLEMDLPPSELVAPPDMSAVDQPAAIESAVDATRREQALDAAERAAMAEEAPASRPLEVASLDRRQAQNEPVLEPQTREIPREAAPAPLASARAAVPSPPTADAEAPASPASDPLVTEHQRSGLLPLSQDRPLDTSAPAATVTPRQQLEARPAGSPGRGTGAPSASLPPIGRLARSDVQAPQLPTEADVPVDFAPSQGTGSANPGPAGESSSPRRVAALPGALDQAGSAEPSPGAPSAAPGGGTGLRRATSGSAQAPPLAGAARGQSLEKASLADLPGSVDMGDDPGPLSGVPSEAELAGPDASPTQNPRRVAALPSRDATQPASGSDAETPAVRPGVPTRRTRPDSQLARSDTGRFILEKSAGDLGLDSRADPAPAFKQRGPAAREKMSRQSGGTTASERAVELGLDFLARHQSRDGHWSLHAFGGGRPGYDRAGAGTMQADTAGTGLALLAFLGAGYSHYDGKHRQTVDAGLKFLVRNQKPDGDLFNRGSKYVWFYSHGIASIALCEAYGMTRDPKLREPAQKALNFIVAAQHPSFGGWRYAPRAGSDTSVSGWQMMALKSGELAGLKVGPDAYAGVTRWLDSAQSDDDPSRYAYRPGAQHAHQRQPSRAMTAEALLMRLYLGWDRSNVNLVEGAEYLAENLPAVGTSAAPLRDAYYWYYATQVMFQLQGEHWHNWNDRLRPLLVDSQVQDGALLGSWDPAGAVPDRWGNEGGRIYVTAMHLLMLEVYYRHLPLYRTLAPNADGPTNP